MRNAFLKKFKDGRPGPDLTAQDWDTYFNLMKLNTSPAADKRYNVRTASICPEAYTSLGLDVPSMPETQWCRYRQYINSVLSAIRGGDTDYCYYIYQIADLLRFEPERLCTKYYEADRYFDVWLL